MSSTEKPKTQKEMIDQLWFAIIGSNGEGLMGQFGSLKKDFYGLREEFHTFIISRESTCPIKKSKNKERDGRWLHIKRWTSTILFGIAVATFVLDKIL